NHPHIIHKTLAEESFRGVQATRQPRAVCHPFPKQSSVRVDLSHGRWYKNSRLVTDALHASPLPSHLRAMHYDVPRGIISQADSGLRLWFLVTDGAPGAE